MRLIDAYALQDEIHKSKMQNPHKDAKIATNHEFEHDHFMQMVVLQPTVHEEIVRCEDCANRECEGRAGTIVCGITGESHSRLWFCADGERMDDNA